MEIHLTLEQEEKLIEFAARIDRTPSELLFVAALKIVEEEDRFQAAVQEGLDQANRGQFIEEDEMNARLERMLRR
jgi:predicted transcriptional regulator